MEFGEKVSFRLQPAQDDRLKSHALEVGESIPSIVNRQLRRLELAISLGVAPLEPQPAAGKSVQHRLPLEVEQVEPFVQRFKVERGIEKDFKAVEHLVNWSCALPLVTPIVNAEEAYQLWVIQFGAGAKDVPIRSALLCVRDRCSLQQAKTWLWELKERDRVGLRIPVDKRFVESSIRIPDGRGKMYFCLDLERRT